MARPRGSQRWRAAARSRRLRPRDGADLRAGRGIVIADVAPIRAPRDPEVVWAYDALRMRALRHLAPDQESARGRLYLCLPRVRPRLDRPTRSPSSPTWPSWSGPPASAPAPKPPSSSAEETERLLIREVDHRAKNVLAVVQSLAQLTPFEDKRQYVAALSGRIGSLARSHSLLSTSRWTGVRLDALLRQELEPYGAGSDDRVILDGPPVLIQADAAQSLGLVLHELATNASKYGALVDVTGALAVTWTWDDPLGNEAAQLILTWRETSAHTP
jgi:two-component sensor histidine kinase